MESQPQNPGFRNNPENFHPCLIYINTKHLFRGNNCHLILEPKAVFVLVNAHILISKGTTKSL